MIAIKGGTIVTVKNGTIKDGVILIQGSTIKEVGQDTAIPPSATVIDAAGCYVTPGFIDAHCHVGIGEEVFSIEGDDINETTDPVTPYLQALDEVNLRDLAFDDAVRSGVTRLMVHPGSANVLGVNRYCSSRGLLLFRIWFTVTLGFEGRSGRTPRRLRQPEQDAQNQDG